MNTTQPFIQVTSFFVCHFEMVVSPQIAPIFLTANSNYEGSLVYLMFNLQSPFHHINALDKMHTAQVPPLQFPLYSWGFSPSNVLLCRKITQKQHAL